MIDDYGSLKTEVAAYLKRTDLTARIPQFIRLAEQDANRRMNTSFDITSRPDGATNWLIENATDVYLYGALAQAALFTKDDADLAKWAQLYVAAVGTAHWQWQEDAGLHSEKLALEWPLADRAWDIEADES